MARAARKRLDNADSYQQSHRLFDDKEDGDAGQNPEAGGEVGDRVRVAAVGAMRVVVRVRVRVLAVRVSAAHRVRQQMQKDVAEQTVVRA